jgi:hypothetical protein
VVALKLSDESLVRVAMESPLLPRFMVSSPSSEAYDHRVPWQQALARLGSLAPPPANRPVRPDWAGPETRLGLQLPRDYQALVETYGAGKFDDYLVVYTPGSPRDTIDLECQLASGTKRLAYHQAHNEQLPYPPEDLLQIAGTDNGESIYWARTPGARPDDWTIVVNAARDWEDWPAFNGGLVEFLVAVFSAEYQCSAFPEDFPSTTLPLTFTSYD